MSHGNDHRQNDLIGEEEFASAISSALKEECNTSDGDDDGGGPDEDLLSYLGTMMCELTVDELLLPPPTSAPSAADDHDDDDAPVYEAVQPFLESSGVSQSAVLAACRAINDLALERYGEKKASNGGTAASTAPPASPAMGTKRLGKKLSMIDELHNQTDADADHTQYLWGGDGGNANAVRANANDPKDQYREINSSKDRRKQKQELERARREYEAKMALLDKEEKENYGTPGQGAGVSSMVLPDYDTGRNERDVQVSNVNLSLDNGRSLLDDADLKFAHGRRYGLVGKNGIGKTTLLKAIARMDIEGFPRHHRVLHVRQEVGTVANKGKGGGGGGGGGVGGAGGSTEEKECSVLQVVIDSDAERNALLGEEREILSRLESVDGGLDGDGDAGADGSSPPVAATDTPSTSTSSLQTNRERVIARKKQLSLKEHGQNESFAADLDRLDEIYSRLAVIGADSAESRAAVILSGLQFTSDMQRGPPSALSGGWRMRVSLAAALFIEPDILMLDEPTNHLDLEAVLWLESYLVKYRHTLIVVSHDRGFLNEVCTDVIEFKDKKLTYYKGDYDTYVKTSAENIKNAVRVYEAYRDRRAHVMEFVDKFRFNAKRASLVQSRIKAVEKMDASAPEEVVVEQAWTFSIPNPDPLGRPIVSIDDVSFDYTAAAATAATDKATGTAGGGGADGDGGHEVKKKTHGEYLLQKVNFGIDLDSRVGILGPNGAGKSTLLNLIMDRIRPTKGTLTVNPHLRIGHFTQHSADKFDLQLSAVENMLAMYENAMDQEMRSFLGRFQIQGTDALKPMMMLSGGQKSRVAFAALAYQKPHVIVMDEPTNHLDMESIDALVGALTAFRGGLVVVSHDQFFITQTCTELWVVGEGRVTRFDGDFNEYKKYTLSRTAKRVAESVKSLSTMNN